MTVELHLKLPIIDLRRFNPTEDGFFYVVNHGVEAGIVERVFLESKKLFSLPLGEKMSLARKETRGYTPLFAEALDPDSAPKGDRKESYYVGPSVDDSAAIKLNQWPSQGDLGSSDEEICGASLHSDYGAIMLLATDGVPGLQICGEKFKQPRVWEDVPHLHGAFIVNIGDMM